MAGERDWRLLLPRGLRELPADLAAVVALVALTLLAVFLPVVRETPLRILLGLPFVLFVPGYAFVAALFPEAGAPPVGEGASSVGDGADAGEEGEDAREVGDGRRDRGIDGIERVALSFGLSIAVVPLLGLVLNFTPWGIRLVPIMVAVSGFTLVATAVAARRRRMLPAEERFAVPYRRWLAGARAELLEPASRTDAALNVLLAASLLLALASVGYAVAVPKQGERFTEFYVLTENESGALVADDYPTEFVAGEPRSLYVGIGNREHEPVSYTVVVELHRVEFVGNDTRVLEERELGRYHPRVARNTTWLRNVSLAPGLVGERLRLTFLLYRGEAPADPSVANAYRELHLWVNVTNTNPQRIIQLQLAQAESKPP